MRSYRAKLEAAQVREEALREQIEVLRAEVRTLKSYLADRAEQLRRYEIGAVWEKSRNHTHERE
jgi:multidrug resistance efflux pump